ncbi:MAG TPA: hypothetical protein VF263_04330 [Longimicrobiaceae bacterium]
MTARPNVELTIQRLVLHGMEPAAGHGLRAAIEAELTRLIVEEGLPPSLAGGGEIPRLPGGTFDVPAGAKPAAVAAQVARSIYGGMGSAGAGAAGAPGDRQD